MRFILIAACLACATLQASVLPTVHLEAKALQTFQEYVSRFEREVAIPFAQSGQLRIDGGCCAGNREFEAGRPVLEARENADIGGASIHHYSAMMHIAGAGIADVRHIMQDYANYPKYFKGDVVKAVAALNRDSTPADEHYTSRISLTESTVWMGVAYDCVYDTHYRRLDPKHWQSISTAASIKEWREPKDAGKGMYPEGDDHGFMWRTNTYWFVRENNGGVDIQLESMTLSRPVPAGFGWWGNRRTRDAVDKMMLDMKTAVETSH
jgi:hypothetical protein